MKVMGVKVSSIAVRYAILERDSCGNISFCNTEDNRLLFPRDATTDVQKMMWLRDHFDRLLSMNADVCSIVLKIPELGRLDSKATRLSHYLDAVILMVASMRDNPIPIEGKTYRSLHTRSKDVQNYVLSKGVSRSKHYWDVAMGDAIVAAISGLE